jgi:hypothetical protein
MSDETPESVRKTVAEHMANEMINISVTATVRLLDVMVSEKPKRRKPRHVRRRSS